MDFDANDWYQLKKYYPYVYLQDLDNQMKYDGMQESSDSRFVPDNGRAVIEAAFNSGRFPHIHG